MATRIELGDLFNPFSDQSESQVRTSVGLRALMLGMLVMALVVFLVVLNLYGSVAEVSGVVRGIFAREQVRAGYNWVGGAAGAHTGFMSETSDPLLGGTSHGQGQAVRLDDPRRERLVPGYKSWPSPTESVPRQWEFSSSPCDIPAPSNANSNAPMRATNANARAGREGLSAVWKNSNERMVSSNQNGGSAFSNRNSMKNGRERMKQEADLADILHGM